MVRWCTRQGCDGKITARSIRDLKLSCPKCHTNICFKCRDEWHGYWVSCEKYMMNKFQEKIKFCPVCSVKISRTEGCNHMTCAFCKYEFCWICLGEGNSEHWSATNPFGCGAG